MARIRADFDVSRTRRLEIDESDDKSSALPLVIRRLRHQLRTKGSRVNTLPVSVVCVSLLHKSSKNRSLSCDYNASRDGYRRREICRLTRAHLIRATARGFAPLRLINRRWAFAVRAIRKLLNSRQSFARMRARDRKVTSHRVHSVYAIIVTPASQS